MHDPMPGVREIPLEDLALAFQPIVDVFQQRIVATEALIRWNRGSNECALPDRFLPVLLRSQSNLHVTRWIVDTALEQLARWHKSGFTDLRICVNLTVAELADPRMAGILCRAADATVPRRTVEIEVCERGRILDTPAALETLAKLRHEGFRVAVDDFGAGSASLRYLLDVPANTVKLDRSFIAGTAKPKDATVLVSIARLAERIGYDVIVEGVENDEQFLFAREHALRYLQGYYVGRPVTATMLSRRLHGERLRKSRSVHVDALPQLRRYVTRALNGEITGF